MATQGERIVALETKMAHLVEMIAQHREEARQAVTEAKADREVMRQELETLTTLAATGKAKLSVLWWLAGLGGSGLGAGLTYLAKYIFTAPLPRL